MSKNNIISVLCLAAITLVSCTNRTKTLTIGPDVTCVKGFYAPWDGLADDDYVNLWTDADSLYCDYYITDTTIALNDRFEQELDFDGQDRIELFFSPRPEMNIYYCAEVDPAGRIMDYSSHYYRQFDYEWDFQTMNITAEHTPADFHIRISISKNELRELGLDLENDIYMGLFKADYHPGTPENWYSVVYEDRQKPDFHIPSQLFPARIL